jgi:hypothetical protein
VINAGLYVAAVEVGLGMIIFALLLGEWLR